MSGVLTAQGIVGLKPRSTAYYTSDGLIDGLQLRVAPNGMKTWSLRYRFARTQRRYTLGNFTILPLAKARAAAKDALIAVGNGIDPAATKAEQRTADTVADLATTYMEKHAKVRKRSWKGDERILNTEVLPLWKKRLAKDINRRDVRALIEGIAVRGPIRANRVRALLSKLFNFGLQQDIVETNPVIGTARPGVEQSRNRVLSHDEVRVFWQACEDMEPTMRAAFRLRLVTAQRGQEVLHMKWQDVDLTAGWWVIPSEYSKNKMPHRVPLSPLAVDILKTLRQAVDATMHQHPHAKEPTFVLRGARGNRQRGSAAKAFAIQDFTPHDLRRTAATMMASTGTPRLVVAKVLNHAEQGVTSIYDRASYDMEKRQALDRWAVVLQNIIDKKDGATVLPFVATA